MNATLAPLLPWLADSLWKTTLLLAVGLGVTGFMSRRASAASAHFAALCVCAGVPLVMILSALKLPLPQWQPPAPAVFDLSSPALSYELPASVPEALATPLPQAAPSQPWPLLLVSAWALGLALVLGHQGIQAARLGKLQTPVAGPQLETELHSLLPIPPALTLLRHAQIATPMTWGWRRPCLALPPASLHWERDRLRSALAHEVAHIQRHDWLTFQLARLCLAPLWFHPLAWWLQRQLLVLQEAAADDAAVRLLGGNGVQYARHLTDIAALRLPSRLALALPMARRSTVGMRVRRLINPGRLGSPASLHFRCLTAALMLGALLPLGLMISCHSPSRQISLHATFADPPPSSPKGSGPAVLSTHEPRTPDEDLITIEVKILEVPPADLKLLDIPLSSPTGDPATASAIIDVQTESRLLRKLLASPATHVTSYPRSFSPDYRDVNYRSLVHIPFKDDDGKVKHVSAGLDLSMLPKKLSPDRIRLAVHLTCSNQIGQQIVKGDPRPIIESHVFNQSATFDPGESLIVKIPPSSTDPKHKTEVYFIKASRYSKATKTD